LNASSGCTISDAGRTTFRAARIRSGRDDPAFSGESAMLSWTALFFAGLLEIAWAAGLKQSAGFTRLLPSLLTVAAMAGSILLLAFAMRSLPLGTAYAVWTGIGTVGAAVLGMMIFGEAATPARILCIAMIVAGIAGLKVTAG
jgi:quaternary ammonium compound-resistance protein SugE